jgi:hypothetical protein
MYGPGIYSSSDFAKARHYGKNVFVCVTNYAREFITSKISFRINASYLATKKRDILIYKKGKRNSEYVLFEEHRIKPICYAVF